MSCRVPPGRLLARVGEWFLAVTVAQVLAFLVVPPPMTAFMVQDRVGELVRSREGYRFRYEWVAYRNISDHVKVAVIAAEDQKFSEHFGFDLESVEKAIEDRERGKRLRGASTISQQVAKNLFLWPGRNVVRKGLEAYYTVLIEALWPKRRILEVYLNTAQFGDGIFGVKAASQEFFGKHPSELTRHEAALLAGVLPSPRRLHADRPSDYLRRRTYNILRFMDRIGGREYLERFWGGAV
ncbi:MAG: monofunctional biosynthetic peptidoglycan transglycosylase [Candidatus Eisenbacteria bacterium]|nr:monofunctional biosynthetic peptidoglycan transglycosylase [Candidatus Eisenbacteria bacterium]